MRRFKGIICIVILILLCAGVPAGAEEDSFPADPHEVIAGVKLEDPQAERICSEMVAAYIRAEERFLAETSLESFTGYCGYCVGYQLIEMGIFKTLHSVNGDASYYTFMELQPEDAYVMRLLKGIRKAGTYNVEAVCRELDEANPDGKMTCTLMTFKVGADNRMGQTYGHVLFIYSVYNGMVYWGETDGIHVETIETFAGMYRQTDRQYYFNGAFVYLPAEE